MTQAAAPYLGSRAGTGLCRINVNIRHMSPNKRYSGGREGVDLSHLIQAQAETFSSRARPPVPPRSARAGRHGRAEGVGEGTQAVGEPRVEWGAGTCESHHLASMGSIFPHLALSA